MPISHGKKTTLSVAFLLLTVTGFSHTAAAQEAAEQPSAEAASSTQPEPATTDAAATDPAPQDTAAEQPAESADSTEPAAAEPATESAAEPVETIPVAELAPEPVLVKVEKSTEVLEGVVVTARKRKESLQNVPLSVTAFSAKQMEQRGYNTLEDIASATPGFTFEGFATGGAHGNPVIRGLAQQFTTTRVQNVSFFLDGVYLQRQSMLNLGLIDMERVEVVKGPQNALYGRSAFAGAVNYITLKPTAVPDGYLSLTLGDNGRKEYRGSYAGPLNSAATLLGKVTLGKGTYDGHTRNNHPVAYADAPGLSLRGNLGGSADEIYSIALAYMPSDKLTMRTSFYNGKQVHEAAPSYSISGVNAARFGLRFDDQNDLNCNTATVNDIQPYPPRTHTGYTLWCGALPRYASDVAPRRVAGIVVDPRAIGTVASTAVATFTTDYDFSDGFSAHYLFGYADHKSFTDGGSSDEDPLAGRGINVNAILTQVDTQDRNAYEFINTASSRPNSILKTFSHELRFDWKAAERLNTSFGVYYSQVKDREWTELYLSDLCNADTAENIANCSEPLSAPNTLAERTVSTAAPAYDQYTRQHGGVVHGEDTAFKDGISAVFGSLRYDFTDTLEGTLETRYTVEDKVVDRFTDSFALAPGEGICYGPNCPASVPPSACTATTNVNGAPVLPVANTLCSGIAVPHDTAKFRNITPRAILNWNYAKNKMVYGSAAKGVKAGGFNNATSVEELTFEEEENWTYELGSKNMFFGRMLTLNGAIYYIDQTTLQGGVPPSVGGLSTSDIITNIGGATSMGIEIESTLNITREFSIDTGLTFSDPKYKKGTKYSAGRTAGAFHCDGITCPTDGDIGGNQLSRTSRNQISGGLNYVTVLGGWRMSARIDTNYQSKQYVEPLNVGWVPARQITNASFRLASNDSALEFTGWVKNLTNEDYAANAFFIGVFNQYLVGKGTARTFGSNIKFNF